jgi:subtilisin
MAEPLPAWSLPSGAAERIALPHVWPERVTRDWAWGGATGASVRVCILDSGVQSDHPAIGEIQESVAIRIDGDETIVEPDEEGDVAGHGTACAGIVRSFAPECELVSVRVLGAGYTGSGAALLEGLRWAVDQGFHVINMSLSTTKQKFSALLHELADSAYFRKTMLVASAHNMPVESYPWRFASVISVGSHDRDDPYAFFYNPSWVGGATYVCTGNSFATPHIAGLAALVLSKHPELTPFQLKSVLYLTATNVGGEG